MSLHHNTSRAGKKAAQKQEPFVSHPHTLLLHPMAWYRSFGLFEVLAITLFILGYALYLYKVIRAAHALRASYDSFFLKLIWRSAAFILLLIALMGPLMGEGKRAIQSTGKDIMICVDLSKSMDAYDVPPTRLEKVKYEMKRLVSAFSSDRIGVIIFSAEAFMQCPLTYDQNALHLLIEAMNSGLVPSGGTDFGPALRLALQKIAPHEGPPERAKSKVIILISDGEDFGEDASQYVRDIERQGVKLFTLGVGTEEGGPIRSSRGDKLDKSGKTVITKLNPAALRDLASRTQGQYFEINNRTNEVNKLIFTIQQIEGEVRDSRFVDIGANQYMYFLLAAMIMLALDQFIPIRTFRI